MNKLIKRRVRKSAGYYMDGSDIMRYCDYVLEIDGKYLSLIDFLHYINLEYSTREIISKFKSSYSSYCDYRESLVEKTILDRIVPNPDCKIKSSKDISLLVARFLCNYSIEDIVNGSDKNYVQFLINTYGKNVFAAECLGATPFTYVYLYGDKLFQLPVSISNHYGCKMFNASFRANVNKILKAYNLPTVSKVPDESLYSISHTTLSDYLRSLGYAYDVSTVHYDPVTAPLTIGTKAMNRDKVNRTFTIRISLQKCINKRLIKAHENEIISKSNEAAKKVCDSWDIPLTYFNISRMTRTTDNCLYAVYDIKPELRD